MNEQCQRGLKAAPGAGTPGTNAAEMTAPDTTRSRSHNSIRHPEGNGESVKAPECDPRLRRIVRYASDTSGSTTRKAIAIRSSWELRTVNQLLNVLENHNFVHLIKDEDCCIVLLTLTGEYLAQEGLLGC